MRKRKKKRKENQKGEAASIWAATPAVTQCRPSQLPYFHFLPVTQYETKKTLTIVTKPQCKTKERRGIVIREHVSGDVGSVVFGFLHAGPTPEDQRSDEKIIIDKNKQ